MAEVRSFSQEEGRRVKKFITDFLKKHPRSTMEEIRCAAQKKFPDTDCVSAVYHLIKDLEMERRVNREVVTSTLYSSADG